MSEEYDDNVVDLAAFRKQKEEEEAEKLRLQREQEEREEIEYMQYLLGNIMEKLGPPVTSSFYYAPMTDDDYFTNYHFESGYDDNGDWYSSWETEEFQEEDYTYEPEED